MFKADTMVIPLFLSISLHLYLCGAKFGIFEGCLNRLKPDESQYTVDVLQRCQDEVCLCLCVHVWVTHSDCNL